MNPENPDSDSHFANRLIFELQALHIIFLEQA
jgi:hypothetical protein